MLTKEEQMLLSSAIEVAKRLCPDSYAQSYLRAIDESALLYGAEGVKVQLLYCLNNMQYWRGPDARSVKKIFKDAIKRL